MVYAFPHQATAASHITLKKLCMPEARPDRSNPEVSKESPRQKNRLFMHVFLGVTFHHRSLQVPEATFYTPYSIDSEAGVAARSPIPLTNDATSPMSVNACGHHNEFTKHF